MVDKQEKQEIHIQTAIRVPESWLERIDKIAQSMLNPGVPITRTAALRSLLYRGLVETEKESKKR